MARRKHDDEDEDLVDPLVAMVRADANSKFYDPSYARPIASASGPTGGWGEFDVSFLEQTRAPVPAFPLDVLPSFWRGWVRDTAQAAGAPADYVALSLIAAVAGLCGIGVRVQVAAAWAEPLVLWQALIGAPSSGKSPAIAPLGTLLEGLRREDSGEESLPASAVVDDPLAALADAASADSKGAMLWCDEPADWLARLGGASNLARARLLRAWSTPLPSDAGKRAPGHVALGMLMCLQPEQLSQMAKVGPELVSRFLFTWPHPPPYCPLASRKAAPDGEALAALRRLVGVAGTADGPLILTIAEPAMAPLDSFLAWLHGEQGETEGLDQAWHGKGRGVVARLIGCLALLDWSFGSSPAAPSAVGRETVEKAILLWRDYLRPHARAVLHHATPDDVEHKAWQVVRWLRARGLGNVSREDVRREALSRSVNAARTDQILHRLQAAGIVHQVHYSIPAHGGRPPNRWEVNPRLIANLSGGNGGNAGNHG